MGGRDPDVVTGDARHRAFFGRERGHGEVHGVVLLFGEGEPEGKRDVLEGRMLWLALEAVKVGTDVVVDYGCWSRDERSAIRWLVEAEDACFRMVYLPVSDQTQRARIARRWPTAAAGRGRTRETRKATVPGEPAPTGEGPPDTATTQDGSAIPRASLAARMFT
ncbi:AAA family ATPase [Spirillospora sp. NPDC052269]